MDIVTLLLGAVLFLWLIYKFGTRNYDYFTSRGIKTVKTVPFLGCSKNIVLKNRSIAYVMQDVCREYKENTIVGFFTFMTPILIVKDPELIKRITVKDFDHFTDHQSVLSNDSEEKSTQNLFLLKGDKWRSMRATLSPAFSSSKLKNMFAFIDRCGLQVVDYLQDGVSKQRPGEPCVLNMKDLFTRFTNDVIATTAFGLQIDSLQEEHNEFYKMGKQITNFKGWKSFVMMMMFLFPRLVRLMKWKIMSDEERDFFVNLVRESISSREKLGIVRPDMIHLLLQARKGELKDEGEDSGVGNAKKTVLTEGDIVAQAIVFFFAGFDTASTLVSFASMLLGTNEDVQTRLREEIDDVLGDGSDLTYEKVQGMKYLDMVVSETLRMYPPLINMDRECTKNYVIPASGKQPAYTVRKGDIINIPAFAIHHDPDYYPDPEKFDPERFSDENKANIIPYTYMPFGLGPRVCIGQRLALLEGKTVLVRILSKFKLVAVDKTPTPISMDPASRSSSAKGGFWLGVTPRD